VQNFVVVLGHSENVVAARVAVSKQCTPWISKHVIPGENLPSGGANDVPLNFGSKAPKIAIWGK